MVNYGRCFLFETLTAITARAVSMMNDIAPNPGVASVSIRSGLMMKLAEELYEYIFPPEGVPSESYFTVVIITSALLTWSLLIKLITGATMTPSNPFLQIKVSFPGEARQKRMLKSSDGSVAVSFRCVAATKRYRENLQSKYGTTSTTVS